MWAPDNQVKFDIWHLGFIRHLKFDFGITWLSPHCQNFLWNLDPAKLKFTLLQAESEPRPDYTCNCGK